MSVGSTVLVVGATGKFAGLVVPELIRRGAKVRALVRTLARAQEAKALGVADVVLGDLRDPASLAVALRGVDGVFHIGPAFSVDEAEMGCNLVNASASAGVRKFVFSSVIQPTNVRLENHASKIPVEDSIYSSSMEYTVLHPSNFMQNIAPAWPGILASGRFSEPFSTRQKVARVDYRDVAEVAAIALTESRLAYATLELAAGMHNRDEVAAIMSEELGRPIEAHRLTFADWVAGVRPPYDGRQLAVLEKVFEHYDQVGLGGNPLQLTAALGREPRTLRQFVRGLVDLHRDSVGA